MAALLLGRQASTLKLETSFAASTGKHHRGCCLYIVSMATAIQLVVNIDLLDLYLNKQTGDQ